MLIHTHHTPHTRTHAHMHTHTHVFAYTRTHHSNSLSCSALSTASPLITSLFLLSSPAIESRVAFTCCSSCRTEWIAIMRYNVIIHFVDTFSVQNLHSNRSCWALDNLVNSPEELDLRASVLQQTRSGQDTSTHATLVLYTLKVTSQPKHKEKIIIKR